MNKTQSLANNSTEKIDETLAGYFMKGDVAKAIAYMKTIPNLEDTTRSYVEIFEEEKYLKYPIPGNLNDILICYQKYFRDVFYCKLPEEVASAKLLQSIGLLLEMPNADEDQLTARLLQLFEAAGYHALFGDTQGHYGPYIWKETVPTTYDVELPGGTERYTVNILRGFIFRSWMDYLTFGEHGTGGWAAKDGTINCIEKAYDFESENFQISFLKHEAQHAVDLRKYPGITSTQLEYRAKLVELIYRNDKTLLCKFISQADESNVNDGHAMASARIKKEMESLLASDLPEIQAKARALFESSCNEMNALFIEK